MNKNKFILLSGLICMSSMPRPVRAFDPLSGLIDLNITVWKGTLRCVGIKFSSSSSDEWENTNDWNMLDAHDGLDTRSIDNGDQSKKNDQHHAQTPVTFADIAGLDPVLARLHEIVDYLKNAQRYRQMGAKVPTGTILYGPPGNGKTLIARAIAHEAGCSFLSASGSEFVELYVGQGAARIRKLFKQARVHQPAIIFIDELDSLATSRSGGSCREYDHALNEFLVQLDGFCKDDAIAVIAATNRIDMIDPALLRHGRLTNQIEIRKPDISARKEILQLYIDKKPLINKAGIDVGMLAEQTRGFSGAELEHLINEAALIAVREQASRIEVRHVERALKEEIARRRR